MMSSAERIDVTRAETIGSAGLWFGVLAGPLVWAAQLLIDYGLDEMIACAPANHHRGTFAGVGIETVIQITNAVATVIAFLAFAVSFRAYRRLRTDDATPAFRARWMAIAGMFLSGLFLMVIVLKFASPVFLSPCGSL